MSFFNENAIILFEKGETVKKSLLTTKKLLEAILAFSIGTLERLQG